MFLALLALTSSLKTQVSQKPVTLALELQTLPAFARSIRDQTGTAIEISPQLKERKLSIFCKGEPLKDILDYVASALRIDMKILDTGITLLPQPDFQERVRIQNDLEKRLADRVLPTVLKQLGDLNGLTSMRKGEFLTVVKREDDLIQAGVWNDPKEEQEHRLRRKLLNNYVWFPIAQAIAANPTSLAALKRGEDILLSNPALPGALHLDNDINLLQVAGYSTAYPEPTCLVRYDRAQKMLIGRVISIQPVPTFSLRLLSFVDEKGPLDSEDDQFPSKAPISLGKRLKDPLTDLKIQDRYLTRGASMGQQLRTIFDAFEVPVVCDDFRAAVSSQHNPQARTLGDYLKVFFEENAQNPLFANMIRPKVAGKWLEFRHARSWQLQQNEIPEDKYQRLESKYESGARIELEDFAVFVQGMPSDQKFSLCPLSCPLSTAPLSTPSYFAETLQFCRSLTSSQRQAAENGLPVENLSPAQYRALTNAARDIAWSYFLFWPPMLTATYAPTDSCHFATIQLLAGDVQSSYPWRGEARIYDRRDPRFDPTSMPDPGIKAPMHILALTIGFGKETFEAPFGLFQKPK